MKRRIKLAEQDVVKIVKRAVNEVRLNEMDWRTYKNAEKVSNKREKEYDKDYDKLLKKSVKDKNYEKKKEQYDQDFRNLKNEKEKESKRGDSFHDYSDELMNKKHNFDKKSKYGLSHQYATSDPDTKSITLHKDYNNGGNKTSFEREFKVPRKNSKTPIEHRYNGNKLKYSYDNPPSMAFSDKSDKNSDFWGDSSKLEKEIMGYNSGKDQYEPGKGWKEYDESLNRQIKRSLRESLRRLNRR